MAPDQALDKGALFAFGLPGHQPGGVAVNPANFGINLPGTEKGNEAAQRRLASLASSVAIVPQDLTRFVRYGAPTLPSPPFKITDIVNKHERDNPGPNFDLYGFPSFQDAHSFGRNRIPTFLVVDANQPCPQDFQEVR